MKSNKANSITEVAGILRQIEGVEATEPILQKSKRRHDRSLQISAWHLQSRQNATSDGPQHSDEGTQTDAQEGTCEC